MDSSSFELISKKLVKPSSPTPTSRRNYKLSLIDQVTNKRYIRLAFFYPKFANNTSEISSFIEESLSEVLAIYYPFAGRLEDSMSINCNDMGATFLEARIKCPMSEIIKADSVNTQDIIFPEDFPWRSLPDDQVTLVVAQLNHFDCGGIALSVCMTHKVGDGRTLCNFINDWAAMASQPIEKPSPQFIGSSILPPIDDPSIGCIVDLKLADQRCITRRYVFHPDKINQLKAKATEELGLENPTRVEVVSALVYKCAAFASMVHSGSFKPSIFISTLNLRPLIGPPVTENYVGNFSSFFSLLTTNERQMRFSELVGQIRREKFLQYEKYKATKINIESVSAILEKAQQSQALQSNKDIEVYGFSSFCRFPTCNIDFGWGGPLKVRFPSPPSERFFRLLDDPDSGGIEATITLPDQLMSLFENDPELLAFASPDHLSF